MEEHSACLDVDHHLRIGGGTSGRREKAKRREGADQPVGGRGSDTGNRQDHSSLVKLNECGAYAAYMAKQWQRRLLPSIMTGTIHRGGRVITA